MTYISVIHFIKRQPQLLKLNEVFIMRYLLELIPYDKYLYKFDSFYKTKTTTFEIRRSMIFM